VFSNLVLSLTRSSLKSLDFVQKKLTKIYGNRVPSPAWLVHAILDSIIDTMVPVVEEVVRDVSDLDELVAQLSALEHRDALNRMAVTRKRLAHLRNRLWSKKEILMSMIGKDWKVLLKDIQIPYLRDIFDHVLTMLEKIETTSEALNDLQANYLAIISIDVAESSNDMNEVMKLLTAISTIMLPLSLITGIFGMNLKIPYQGDTDATNPANWRELAPFWVLSGAMILYTLLVLSYFKRVGFL